ncbi:hypothetical protein R1flu_012122 [Riccia fluitans]|uniref:Uncharacterized protein n=1 Tax=Riccia fluitans TaxID=41844 RepID=A0ABD1Z9Q5_9MARC
MITLALSSFGASLRSGNSEVCITGSILKAGVALIGQEQGRFGSPGYLVQYLAVCLRRNSVGRLRSPDILSTPVHFVHGPPWFNPATEGPRGYFNALKERRGQALDGL